MEKSIFRWIWEKICILRKNSSEFFVRHIVLRVMWKCETKILRIWSKSFFRKSKKMLILLAYWWSVVPKACHDWIAMWATGTLSVHEPSTTMDFWKWWQTAHFGDSEQKNAFWKKKSRCFLGVTLFYVRCESLRPKF